MKSKFKSGMIVSARRLVDEHRKKGFETGVAYKCFTVNRNDNDISLGGIWIKTKDKDSSIRLQDLNGTLTGHGTFFEPKQKEKTENDEAEENYN